MAGELRAIISLFTLVLLWKSPRSEKFISEAIDCPFLSSSISRDAVRVYTGGVFRRYIAAIPRHTARESTNHFHLEMYIIRRSLNCRGSSCRGVLDLFSAITVDFQIN